MMPNMEAGFGWHYPPGTPGARTEHGTFTCVVCGESSHVAVTYELGGGFVSPEECPNCGESWTGDEQLTEDDDGPDPDDELDRMRERQEMERDEDEARW